MDAGGAVVTQPTDVMANDLLVELQADDVKRFADEECICFERRGVRMTVHRKGLTREALRGFLQELLRL